MIDFSKLHICDRCYSVYGQERTAFYRVKGILVKWSYFCLDHATQHTIDYPDCYVEYSENGYIQEENNQYWKEE